MLTVTKMKALIAPQFPAKPMSYNLSKFSPFASKSNLLNPQNVQSMKLFNSKLIMNNPRLKVFSLQNRLLHGETSSASPISSSSSAGEVHVIVGPMFAGKTTTLLRRIQAETEKGRNVAVIKSNKDTRYGVDSIVTHDGVKLPCSALACLSSFKHTFGSDAYDQLDVIGIDEAQFFEDLYDFCREAADNDGKTVIVAGLDGDYLRRSFGSVLDIIPLADSVTKLTARCEFCGKRAFFTLRKTEETETELIGGSDIYMPVCRQHYVSGQVVVEAARIVLESQKAQCSSCL